MVRANRHCANSAVPVFVLALVLLGSVPYIQYVMYSRAIRAELESKVERLEREHVADSRRMRQMEDAAVKAQSRLKTSERQVAEQSQRYQALEQLLQNLQLKEGVCEGNRKSLSDELDVVTKKLESVYKMEVQLKQRTKERDKAQDDNSALEAEVARLKAGMSQALTEAKSQLQAAQDQVVLEARKAATYREELTAQEGAAKTARTQAKRLASRHAATLEALNARARQVASLRADLEKLLQGQDATIVLGILRRAGVDPEEEAVEYDEDTDQEPLSVQDELELTRAAGRELNPDSSLSALEPAEAALRAPVQRHKSVYNPDPRDATLADEEEEEDEEDDQAPNDPLMVQMGPPWSDSHRNKLHSPRPGGVHKEEAPVLNASNQQQPGAPGDEEEGEEEEDEEETDSEIPSQQGTAADASASDAQSQQVGVSSDVVVGDGDVEEAETEPEKGKANGAALEQQSMGQQATTIQATGNYSAQADQEVADNIEDPGRVDAVSGAVEVARSSGSARDEQTATQTASNADVEDAQPGVDAIQADESTDPALREDGIASVEKVRAQWRKRMKKLSNQDTPSTATNEPEHAADEDSMMSQLKDGRKMKRSASKIPQLIHKLDATSLEQVLAEGNSASS
mmetsp:Transcript_4550/g.8534  ORF Transcript_4550/g.8534 Transcript_4550/m.8534 type:complete len:630 (+) Transcript_4550:203-2092(+)